MIQGRITETRLFNPTACYHPSMFQKQQCQQCQFFKRCIFERKLIKYKMGKPVLYKDLTEEEKKGHHGEI